MQNKPNFRKSQMNANLYNTTNYKNFIPLAGQKNKPNSNPIKPNFKRAKMNISYVKTTNYEQKTMNYANNKQTQFLQRPKMNANVYVIEDYENETTFRPQKNKPNSNPISSKAKIACRKIRPFQKPKKKSGQSRKERLESLFCINSSRRRPRP